MRLFTALLAAALSLAAAQGAAQVLPFGEFAARDGRPGEGRKWWLDDAQGTRLAEQLSAVAARTPIVIDYDHQTLRAEANGQPAPAAGWMKSFEWRTGAGMWATVEWTERAAALIGAGEYRYLSPVIQYDKQGKVTGVLLAALVNHPALLGMEPVIARLATQFTNPDHQEATIMDLAALAALLGLGAGATEADVRNKIAALLAAKPPALSAALSTELGLAAGADEAAALGALRALKSADSSATTAMRELQQQVSALTAQINEGAVTALVDGAIAAHKLLPAQRDWALGFGRKDVEGLKTFIAGAPVIPGLGGQSGGKDPGAGGSAALSAQAAEICQRMGLTREQFDKAALAA